MSLQCIFVLFAGLSVISEALSAYKDVHLPALHREQSPRGRNITIAAEVWPPWLDIRASKTEPNGLEYREGTDMGYLTVLVIGKTRYLSLTQI
jgi:hypothetical protein